MKYILGVPGTRKKNIKFKVVRMGILVLLKIKYNALITEISFKIKIELFPSRQIHPIKTALHQNI